MLNAVQMGEDRAGHYSHYNGDPTMSLIVAVRPFSILAVLTAPIEVVVI
jgi:hypothetical protein